MGRSAGPAFECLAAREVRFEKAYTPCPVCSPARESLLTGLMPHNHGVLEGVHGVDADQAVLRTEKPHWAQKLMAAGYRTGYFGKWHLERSGRLEKFGWDRALMTELWRQVRQTGDRTLMERIMERYA